MTITQQIITIAMVVFGTMLTRFLPFLLFPAGKPTPKYIQYLGKVLPAAVFGGPALHPPPVPAGNCLLFFGFYGKYSCNRAGYFL